MRAEESILIGSNVVSCSFFTQEEWENLGTTHPELMAQKKISSSDA